MMKPLIGITGRRVPSHALSSLEERYRLTNVDMYFSDFPQWVAQAGGLPIELPYEAASPDLLGRIDGLIITGGQDVDPALWGGDLTETSGPIDPQRDFYEIQLALAAVQQRVPLLGVCRGAQILNVALGGTLVGDLPTNPIDHRAPGFPVETLHHDVTFVPGSLAAGLFGPTTLVNSLHHQAVLRCGEGLEVTGRASDGTVEALEMPGAPVLAVQWHPEWMGTLDPSFQWLVNCSLDRAAGIDVSV